jgi:hypothetical protein
MATSDIPAHRATLDRSGPAARGVTTRVRGLATWRPRSETLGLLDQVRSVLHEYESYLPLLQQFGGKP